MDWFELYMPGDLVWVHVKDAGFHFSFPGVVSYCRAQSLAVSVQSDAGTEMIEVTDGDIISKRPDTRELTMAGKKCSAIYNQKNEEV